MDEIVRRACREAWGPLPGESDYGEILYTTAEVSAPTGIGVNALGARVARGNLAGVKVGPRCLISDYSSVLAGLLPSRRRRGSVAVTPAPTCASA